MKKAAIKKTFLFTETMASSAILTSHPLTCAEDEFFYKLMVLLLKVIIEIFVALIFMLLISCGFFICIYNSNLSSFLSGKPRGNRVINSCIS